MQKPDLRDIHQLTKDEFKRILGPIAGSLDDDSKVVLGMPEESNSTALRPVSEAGLFFNTTSALPTSLF